MHVRCSRRQHFCHSAKLSVCVSRDLCSVSLIYCSIVSYTSISSSMSKASAKTNKGESRWRYRLCVPSCPCYVTSGDTHTLCMVCLGVKHAESAFEGADCPHFEWLPLRMLRSRNTLFEEGVFTSIPHGAGPASAEAERQLHLWGTQLDLD